jgi:hypothetical protein
VKTGFEYLSQKDALDDDHSTFERVLVGWVDMLPRGYAPQRIIHKLKGLLHLTRIGRGKYITTNSGWIHTMSVR